MDDAPSSIPNVAMHVTTSTKVNDRSAISWDQQTRLMTGHGHVGEVVAIKFPLQNPTSATENMLRWRGETTREQSSSVGCISPGVMPSSENLNDFSKPTFISTTESDPMAAVSAAACS